jgi:hypothetical protein
MLESLPTPTTALPLLTFDRLPTWSAARRPCNCAGGSTRWPVGSGWTRLVATCARSARLGSPAAAGAPCRVGGEAPPPRPPLDESDHLGAVPIRNRSFSGRIACWTATPADHVEGVRTAADPARHGRCRQDAARHQYMPARERYDIVSGSPPSSPPRCCRHWRSWPSGSADHHRGPPTTARTVLDALAGTELSWLLVYDNADDPALLDQYVPSTGGHVIDHSQEWATLGQPIEVDVCDGTSHRAAATTQPGRRRRDPDPHRRGRRAGRSSATCPGAGAGGRLVPRHGDADQGTSSSRQPQKDLLSEASRRTIPSPWPRS